MSELIETNVNIHSFVVLDKQSLFYMVRFYCFPKDGKIDEGVVKNIFNFMCMFKYNYEYKNTHKI